MTTLHATKRYLRGMQKIVNPLITRKRILKKLRTYRPRLLQKIIKIYRTSNIPQYQIVGSSHFFNVVGARATNGKGHTDSQALVSGLMELAERYSCFTHLNRPDTISTIAELPITTHTIYRDAKRNFCTTDPWVGLSDKEMSSITLRWFKGKTILGGSVFFPLSLLLFTLEGTNGMASGNTLEEATLQGICEVIERHCLTLIKKGELPTNYINPASIDSPVCLKLIKLLTEKKQKLYIRDFSLGLGVPVIGVIRVIGNGCLVTAGVASSRTEALIRALTENSQSEALKRLYRKQDYQYLLGTDQVIPFHEINEFQNNDIRREIHSVAKLLEKKNMQILVFDATHEKLSIPSVIVCILGAKYFNQKNSHLNCLTGLITESISLGKKDQAERLIAWGLQKDPSNATLYKRIQNSLGSPKNSSSSKS